MNRTPLLLVLFLLVLFSFNGTQLALAQFAPNYTDLDFELAAEQGETFTYQFPPYLFTDGDNDPMTYALRDDNGAAVGWLAFNQLTKTLSGTPGATELSVGVYELIITATDDEGPPQSSDSRVIFLTILAAGTNDAPQENTPVPNQNANTGDPYAYAILQNVLTDADGQSFTLRYELTLDDGNPIPAWLTFEPWRRQLSGTPAIPDVGTLSLRFGAFDQNGAGNYSYFQLTVQNASALDVTSVGSLTNLPVAHATPFASITFPSQVQVTLEDMSTRMIDVSFPNPGIGVYNPVIAGSHAIPGNLINLPGDVINPGNLQASVNVVVAMGNQSITFAPDPLPAKTVADITTTFSLTSTSTSGLPVSYTSADPGVASISGTTVTINGGGSTLITASQSGSSNYNPATPVGRTLTVSRNSQTITFTSLSPVTFGSGNFNLTATASSGLGVIYSSSDINVATISGNTVSIVHAGTVTITALQPGNTLYDPANPVDQVLVINKANQVISFGPLPGKNRTDPNFFLSASVNTGLPLVFTSSLTSVAVIGPAFNEVAIQNIGVTVIKVEQAGNGDYNSAFVNQTLTVGGQTITFGPLANKTFADPDFGLTASASSGLTVSYTSSNPAVATILLGSTVHIVGVGTTTITASQAGNSNYLAATPVDQPFTVTKLSQTITFGPLANKLANEPPFTLSATATSGLTVSFASSNPAVATVSGNTVTITGIGTTTITASQAGDATYDPAANAPQPFTVVSSTQDQTITFPTIPDQTNGDSPYTLNATATSGLSVVYSTTSDKVTLTGSLVSFVKSGRLNINANQPGSSTYNPAPQVTRSFCIRPAKPFISGAQLNSPSPVLTSTATAGNQWFFNNVAIAGATGVTITAQQSGVYTVQATTDDCVSAKSDNFPVIVTGDLYDPQTAMKLYPNPAESDLYVSWPETTGTSLVRIFQLDGKEIERLTTSENELSIPVGHYAGGHYVLSIQTTKAHFRGRFLKK